MWRKVEQDNQWEYRTTYVMVGKKKIVLAQPKYKIMWPNGKTEEVDVEYKEDTRWYNDMGHEYSSTSKLPFITINHNGTKVTQELYGLDCKVWVVMPS